MRVGTLVVGVLVGLAGGAGEAGAQEPCGHAVVLTLPGVTWSDVGRISPPHLLAAAEDGAVGSMSVRTISARTSYASGFATLGAGARVEGGVTTGAPAAAPLGLEGELASGVRAGGVEELRSLAAAAGYGARPGALGEALDRPVVAIGNADAGRPPPTVLGLSRWTLLAAMDTEGLVERAATGPELLRRDATWPYGVRTDPGAIRRAVEAGLALPCSTLVIDQGDVTRADALAAGDPRSSGLGRALEATDKLIGFVRARLDPAEDLLLLVSPTSPLRDPESHLGVALAVGPRFEPGSPLASPSTRRAGLVTLPDVAPTILEHFDETLPAAMNGRSWFTSRSPRGDLIAAAIDLDRESVFIDRYKSLIATGFVVLQILVYLVTVPLLARRERGRNGTFRVRWPEPAALAIVAFPVATYLAGAAPAHELGLVVFIALLAFIDVITVALAFRLHDPMDRLLALVGFTTIVLLVDLLAGARLQLNTVFGYSPIVAGRFAGTGNTAFAVLGAAAILTGALLVHRFPAGRAALVATAALFATVVIVDGAPHLGSDIGGVLALVPALGITWVLLSGRRPRASTVVLSALAGLGALALFLALDLSRPPEARTHLARLAEDVGRRGPSVLVDTVERKARANLRVFRSTIYTFFVPPALGVMAWLLRRPRGRWQLLARDYPRLRAGLVGGLVLAVLGFAVNDSGIVIPAVILSYLLPMALLVHLVMARAEAAR